MRGSLRRRGLVLSSVLLIAAGAEPADPYLWLEEVEGERALTWVEERNAESLSVLQGAKLYGELEARLLAIFDSDERIPGIRKIGDRYYNFWRDADHVRGVWRRTTLESFAADTPEWEVVLDLDVLAKREGESWVWAGATCLEPDSTLCLISLSRGGGDAHVVREFDLARREFVAGGFALPEAKHRVAWRDRDNLYVATDFGPGTLTTSGYPRIAKLWKRGTALTEATIVLEGEVEDVSVAAYRDHRPGFERDFAYRSPTFYSSEVFWLRDGERVPIEKPADASVSVFREWLLFRPRSPWKLAGRELAAGSLVAARFDAWLEGRREIEVLFTPSERTSLAGFGSTKSHVLLNVLDNVKNRLFVLTPADGGFERAPLAGVPEVGTAGAWAVDAHESDAIFASVTGYLEPTALLHGTVEEGVTRKLKQLPAYFRAAGLRVSQHDAVSADGTRIPYFLVGPEDLVERGPRPTIVSGYGGFEVSRLPGYVASVGAAWLERGGVYVVANIRGGGEFGPRWHQAALREKRPRAYEDFIAVAEDLVARKVTTPAQLGAMGGSNGGLLVGNMLVRRPDLFGAIVCQVPLLDMRRYHELLAGASWMAEYGNPDDPEDWEFIRGFSPYHQVAAGAEYPPVLFLTSTRDDRVHPGHARKMAAKMRAQGHELLYYENTEGGHAGAADNAQQARMSALAYTFLWRELSEDAAGERPGERTSD